MDKETKIKRKIDRINDAVCQCLNVDVKSLYERDRTNKTTTARGFAIYILHDNGVSINRLAIEYNRIPRAIFWHCAKIRNFIKCYPDYREKYNAICEMLK